MLQRISRRAQVVLPAAGAGAGAPSWLERLRAALPAEQQGHLVEVLEKEQALLLFVDSAAWASRIRLSLPALDEMAAGRRLELRIAPQRREPRGQ